MEDRIVATGKKIFEAMQGQTASIFDKGWWTGKVMDWTMQRPEFKVAMFRFVDVLPYLHSSEQVAKHLREYFMGEGQDLPPVLQWGIGGIAATGIGSRIAGAAIKKKIEQMARQFIVGEDARDALKGLQSIIENGFAFTVDILGEAALSEAEAQHYQQEYMQMLEVLHAEVPKWKGVENIRQPLNVSVKLSSIYSQIDPAAFDHTVARLKDCLLPIFCRAKELGIFINLDMESFAHKAVTLEVFRQVLQDPAMSGYTLGGIAIQAYLRDAYADVQALIEWARQTGIRPTVRLVKGAYWDYEAVNATQKGWPCPVFTTKSDTDANFESVTQLLLENSRRIGCAIASHNVRSVAFAIEAARTSGLGTGNFEFQTLYGMAEPIKQAIRAQGYQVREYAPVGALIPGMAYLVRRLLENTSNESWLRARFTDTKSADDLLKAPVFSGKIGHLPANAFVNESPADFSRPENRTAMDAAIEAVRRDAGSHYPLRIDGRNVESAEKNHSVNPTHPQEIIGTFAMATEDHADAAIAAAQKAFTHWRQTPAPQRTAIFRKAVGIMRARRFTLAATQVLEVGKNWHESDADVCEAIDFLNYYADEMERLEHGDERGCVPGEQNRYHYIPKGVGIVIAPWNFPLAISTGMVAASLVTGNTVIYKPSEQSTVIGAQMVAILEEAGLPPGVLNFLPGKGSVVGKYLVEHPAVAFIVFTGSREVGLRLIQYSNAFDRGQAHVKRVIAEMGGKNAVIVDADADLDEAVQGVVKSAFGFSGQKCSACSRTIVLEENFDRFMLRLSDAAHSMIVGDPVQPQIMMGPVIDAAAQKNILEMIETGKRGARLAFQGHAPREGYFVPPTIFADVAPNAVIAQEEIFGPVLAVIRVKTFEEALAVANSTKYALTGGVYSRSPDNIALARRDFMVGNLYINRPCTGAIVQRHPFGGFKLSGVGSKAGGPDYLLQFMEPRNISENTLRRGFAPEILDVTL